MPAMDFGESLHILDGRADVTAAAVSFPSTSSSSPLKKFLHHSHLYCGAKLEQGERKGLLLCQWKKGNFFSAEVSFASSAVPVLPRIHPDHCQLDTAWDWVGRGFKKAF